MAIACHVLAKASFPQQFRQYSENMKHDLPVVGVRDALHTAVRVMDANSLAWNSILTGVKSQKIRLEFVRDGSCDHQEQDVRLAVIEHQPHTLQHHKPRPLMFADRGIIKSHIVYAR